MELSAELRDRRKAAGRTIASVAVDAGLSVPYIANLENGRGNPTLAALSRLATALGAHLQLTLEDDPPPAAAGAPAGGTSGATSGGDASRASGRTSCGDAGGASGRTSGGDAGGAPGETSGGDAGGASGWTDGAPSGGSSGGASGRTSGGTSGVASAALLASSPRATKVIATLASSQGRTRRSVERQLLTALEALSPLLPTALTESDLNRLLDLLLLAD